MYTHQHEGKKENTLFLLGQKVTFLKQRSSKSLFQADFTPCGDFSGTQSF